MSLFKSRYIDIILIVNFYSRIIIVQKNDLSNEGIRTVCYNNWPKNGLCILM